MYVGLEVTTIHSTHPHSTERPSVYPKVELEAFILQGKMGVCELLLCPLTSWWDQFYTASGAVVVQSYSKSTGVLSSMISSLSVLDQD